MSHGSLSSKLTLIARYAETDAQGVIHHANYLTWFEEGRSDFLRQQGVQYRDWEAMGIYVVVAAIEVKYLAPAFYEDRITIQTTLVKLREPYFKFHYQAFNQDNSLLAEGTTRHLLLNKDRKPTHLPESIKKILAGEKIA